MDSEQFKKAAYAAVDEIAEYYDTIDHRRVVSTVEPGYLKQLLPAGPPETGEQWTTIQKDISSKIMPGLTHWQSPNFMAFFPASSSFPGILGELYSSAFTAAAFNWICSPAITELESIVLDWLARMLSLPACFLSAGEGGGVIQGSASEAIVVVMIAARDRCLQNATKHLQGKEREEEIARLRPKLVALGSTMTHSSTNKAALITGVRYRSVPVGKEDDFSLRGKSLEMAIGQCVREGLLPFFLTANLGTTSTCAVDNFGEIAHIADVNPDLWVHVDAAWAGAALICEEHQHHAGFFDHFDSFNVNMHKWLLTNFDASCLFVKSRRPLIDALSVTPAYLRNPFTESGFVTDYRDWQMPLGRRFRALKIWFVMRTYGVQGMRAHVRNHIALGELFSCLVKGRADLFQVLAPPAFALTVFRVVPEVIEAGINVKEFAAGSGRTPDANGSSINSDSENQANNITQQVYELINARGEIFLTSTVLDGTYAIRVVSANLKTDEPHLRRAFDIIVETTQEVLGKGGRSRKSNGVPAGANGRNSNGVTNHENDLADTIKEGNVSNESASPTIPHYPQIGCKKRKSVDKTDTTSHVKRSKIG